MYLAHIINNLKTGLKREKGPFLAQITYSMRMGKAPRFKLISLKEHQIWENQDHELNTHDLSRYYLNRKLVNV